MKGCEFRGQSLPGRGGSRPSPAALRVIRIDSLDGWLADGPSSAGPGAREDFFDVLHGRAVLRLPDGKRYWLPVWGYAYAQNLDRRVGEALLGAVMDHNTLADHDGPTPIFFDASTNDPAGAYCTRCRRYVDLNEDVQKMQRLRRRDLDWQDE